ncbi:kinase-like domain-containing protein [Entophlyctis helioformis]|nr:kinase-like domain-containing protein [Entophlyctis helioformis]
MADSHTLIKQGAEARVFKTDFGGRPAIVKQRFKKAYRHPVLDEKLTARRVVQEARCLHRLRRAGLDTPALYLLDTANSCIYMEFVEGETVRDVLRAGTTTQELESIAAAIGTNLAVIHDMDVVHGDLTTSNMILRKDSRRLVWIDFGLSYSTTLSEDKGVDLYVLERAIISTHPRDAKALFNAIMAAYRARSKNAGPVTKKFEEVRQRGRKRTAFG